MTTTKTQHNILHSDISVLCTNQSNNLPDLKPLSPLPRFISHATSTPYRSVSASLVDDANDVYNSKYLPNATLLAGEKNISIYDALKIVNPNENEDQWTRLQIELPDLQIGDKIISKDVQVTCNVMNPSGKYFDTIALIFLGKTCLGFVKYNKKILVLHDHLVSEHSGDLKPIYNWLRHVVTFNLDELRKLETSENKIRMFIVSSGWLHGNSDPVKNYINLKPVVEIRSKSSDGTLKRSVIAQRLDLGDDNTSVINACITSNDDGTWTTEIMELFSLGFEGNMNPIIKKIQERIENNKSSVQVAI